MVVVANRLAPAAATTAGGELVRHLPQIVPLWAVPADQEIGSAVVADPAPHLCRRAPHHLGVVGDREPVAGAGDVREGPVLEGPLLLLPEADHGGERRVPARPDR